MHRTIGFLQQRATGRTILILLVVTLVVYATILLYTIPAVLQQAPDLALFDMSPGGYSFSYAQELLTAIGPQGREIYLTRQLPLDFVYPGLFAVTYTLLLTWLFGKSFAPDSRVYYFVFVPALAGLFDYLENVGIILMLNAYPHLSAGMVAFASVCSVLKSIFTIGFYLLLLVGLVALVRRRVVVRG